MPRIGDEPIACPFDVGDDVINRPGPEALAVNVSGGTGRAGVLAAPWAIQKDPLLSRRQVVGKTFEFQGLLPAGMNGKPRFFNLQYLILSVTEDLDKPGKGCSSPEATRYDCR
jgi:hypothetical protein